MENKLTNTVERIIHFIKCKSISKREFAKKVGVSHSLIGKSKTIGSDKLENILSVYPEINPEWLIMGNGNMLRKSKEYAPPMLEEVKSEYGKKSNTDDIEELKKEITYLKKIIDLLERENHQLLKLEKNMPENEVIESEAEQAYKKFQEREFFLDLRRFLKNEIAEMRKQMQINQKQSN
jgi:polyhydroxyalkanoate synthesis regulator protein